MSRTSSNAQTTPRRLGVGMIALAWIVLLGMLTAYFSGWLERQRNPNAQVASTVVDGGVREVALKRNRGGQYVARGRINQAPVTFLLDTGAATVSVPSDIAEALALQRGRPTPAQTANGIVITYATRLDRVEIGNIVLRDIRAHINPGEQGNHVLLGMTFLRHLELLQRGDTLTLRQYPADS